MRPAPHCRTPILSYSLDITPSDRILNWQFDPLSNHLARAIFPSKTTEFTVDVNLVADLTPYNPFAFFLEPGFESFPFQYPADQLGNLEPYRAKEPFGPLLKRFVAELSLEKQGTIDFLVSLNQKVRDAVGYVTRLEHGVQTCEQTLTGATGSCRDSAWLLVQICRQVGLAARFVSGYLIQLVEDEPSVDGPPGPTVDSADLHAWTEVYLPGAGWIGLDPTSGLFTSEGHIPLVCTPTASQAAPISGTSESARVDFGHTMSVKRLNEAPSLTKPYSDDEWLKIRGVAHAIDRDVKHQDIRLTMGGEPTYVGIDEPEAMQWNIEALGPLKRTRGLALIRCLRERTAPGGLLHFGQGKWYPGEPLPRWAFHCVSRLDGVPVWENVDLFAFEDKEYGFTVEDSFTFLKALTHRLQVSASDILPAFNQPDDNGDPTTPAGYILPLRRRQPEGRLAWSSQLWFPRPHRLVLSWGDSPIGYRITVDSMPFVAPDELVYDREDGELVKLPAHPARRPDLFAVEPTPDPLPPLSSTAETAKELIRPSLCVEAREGRLHVFLPYVSVVADYLDLVAAIEDTAQFLEMPIWIEGYTPPHDLRLRAFSLTPDPGVLEVNLPPTDNWDDLEALNAVLADEAHKNRLIAGKFAYDGSHLATGGGSHIVIGANSVPDSPLLRRPDLLRSMVSFWQNHPSLSYLFSGMYVGPTSQYPRVDEARADALYELEVSFSQLTGDDPPYILDGLFRNLLVDVTGNTHRAEFCIDKLFPPEGQGLRLGLLELRAFEMAPHYRMGLMQMLLVRALVCAFWKQPFTGSLLRWGTALHDRFMLPHFVQRDFAEVLGFLQRGGYPLEDKWFASHVEFRFPKIGSIQVDGVELELRQALEPWNVLAEETSSGRTGRSVDSSLERMQVKVTGLTTESRYIVTCNGRQVPLHPTGEPGEAVAGIRYRARRLSAALHPTIPVHTPLSFELIDTWKQRSIGRCTYFAGPPDGTIHTTRPENATEAKARRLQRFQVSEPSSDPIVTPGEEHNPIFPMTLDLRWPAPDAALIETPGVAP
ncbi:Large protein containing transglutaminase-like domain [Granulicella sibirica]|uniref:Large protein containing transglutaminase-like domain n=1 Tax=Granulicella sibirica TaxID=2479048 RepID=A0A4Q0SY61_9BACT|nr:Large protein containing transglutaminase-like domain [Granulicella sibirica]